MGPASAGPVTTLSQQDVARDSAPAQGDRPGNDLLSPSVDPSAVGCSESFKGPDFANHARQPDPRQNIFEALCDDPSLTREDALALLAIRDEALANDAVITQIWSRQRIVDAARELTQRSPLHCAPAQYQKGRRLFLHHAVPKQGYLKMLDELIASAEREETYLSVALMESISAKADFELYRRCFVQTCGGLQLPWTRRRPGHRR